MKSLLFIAGVFFSTASSAAGWTAPLTISSFFSEGKTDLIIVYTADDGNYTTGCLGRSWSITTDTSSRAGRVYATLLTALTTGKKVKFWYTDSCGPWSYHEATAVMIVN